MLVDAYFIADCLVCNQGLLILRTTSQKTCIVCVCDECENVWTDLHNLDAASLLSEQLKCNGYSQILEDFVFGGDSHWSSEQELKKRGLLIQTKGIVKTPK